MPDTQRKLTQGEKDVFTQFYMIACELSENGVYMGQLYSTALACPILLLCAFGDQAMAVQNIIMQAAAPDEATILERPAAKEFMSDH